jgi:N-acetylglucosamine repressor
MGDGIGVPYFRHIRQMRASDSRIVRQLNEQVVFGALRRHGTLSVPDLARLTGLSASSVKTMLQAFIRMGLVLEAGEDVSGGGRPPALYGLNLAGRFVLGVELRTDTARIGLCRLNGSIVRTHVFAVSGTGPEPLPVTLRSAIGELLAAEGVPVEHVEGAGIAQHGLVDAGGTTHVRASDGTWVHRNYLSEIQADLPFPVFVLDDGDTRLVAEMEYGAAVGQENALYVEIWGPAGTGVTGGLVSHNLIATGHHGLAGKFGMITVPVAGGGSSTRAQSWNDAGSFDELRASIRKLHRDIDVSTPERIGAYFLRRDGESSRQAVLSRFVRIHAAGVGSLIHAFDPAVVIIGGRFLELGPHVAEELRHEILVSTLEPFVRGTSIEFSLLQSDGAILGAAAYVLQHVVQFARERSSGRGPHAVRAGLSDLLTVATTRGAPRR